jgi:hypothetical protein
MIIDAGGNWLSSDGLAEVVRLANKGYHVETMMGPTGE